MRFEHLIEINPLPTGAAWLDTMILGNAEEFFALLARFPQVKAVVFGHIHQAMDVSRDGLRLRHAGGHRRSLRQRRRVDEHVDGHDARQRAHLRRERRLVRDARAGHVVRLHAQPLRRDGDRARRRVPLLQDLAVT